MTKIRCLMLTSLLGGVLLLGGCSTLAGTNCQKAPGPADTQDHGPLRIPVGLDGPDTREAMEIPELDVSAVPPFATRCLEDPPLLAPLATPDTEKEAKAKAKEEDKAKDKPKRRNRGQVGPPGRSGL